MTHTFAATPARSRTLPRASRAPRLKSPLTSTYSERIQITAASLAVSAGVNVLALARMLGHKDPSVTLRVYADLFDTDLDAVAVTLHSTYSRENVGKMWAQGASEGS